ncbi:MAG: RNA polymerase sigma factor [bacterium]|nr:RNA polymerase sigma factor [bacterium]
MYLDDTQNELTEKRLTDEELLAVSLRSPGKFGLIVDRYAKAFNRKAVSILRDRELSDTAVQDAFVKIYRFAPKFLENSEKNFKAWAYKILTHTCFTAYSKRRVWWQRFVSFDDMAYEIRDPSSDSIVGDIERNRVISMLDTMPEKFRSILRLHAVEELSNEEIAVKENMSEGAVRTKLSRAKKEFRRIYSSILC